MAAPVIRQKNGVKPNGASAVSSASTPPGEASPPNSARPEGGDYYTLPNGCPIRTPQSSQRIGRQLRGTALIQDINLVDIIAHITQERIPERLVHPKAAGAYGEFEVTHDISDITSAAFLSKVGQKTKLFSRFSTVAGEKGSADSVRDTRGFAFKLYTSEGNLDWLFFSVPVFFIRDPAKFPSLTHAQKRNPRTNFKDTTGFWDYFNHHPEGYHTLLMLFSDRGTPVSYRYADIFSINTYKFTKTDGSFKYVRIHLKTDQGVKNLTQDEATVISGQDPDYTTRDLYEAIEKGNYPSWTVYAQVIDPVEAETYKTNIFDATKTISQKDYPLIPFGKITLNKNVTNYFSEVEQSAFAPANIVPGWDITPDPILQIRLFAYGETQRYRLGVNFDQLPINRPLYTFNPTRRDGAANIFNYGDQPGYITSNFQTPIVEAPQYEERAAHEEWLGTIVDFQSKHTDEDFVQPRDFWEVLGKEKDQQKNLIYNVAVNLSGAEQRVRSETYKIFRQINNVLGDSIARDTENLVKDQADGQEIPGIVVGGEILPNAPISGNGTGPTPTPVKSNGENLRERLHSVLEDGHLFNLVHKGIHKAK